MGFHGSFSNKINGKTFLLDKFPAISGYSFRKLRNQYNGPAITVTNLTTNLDKDIYFDNQGNLDINSLLTFANNKSVGIKLWHDQSKNWSSIITSDLGLKKPNYYGVPFYQTTSSNMPLIVNNGSLYYLNNRPCGYFNGSSFSMQRNDLGLPTGFATYITISYSLSSSMALNTYQSVFNYGVATTGSSVFLTYGDDSLFGNDALGSSNYGNSIGTINQLSKQNFMFSTKPASTDVWKNWINNSIFSSKSMTTNTALVNSSGSDDGTACRIGRFNGANGGGSYLNGYIQEVIIWDKNLEYNRNEIEQNVNSYYKIWK